MTERGQNGHNAPGAEHGVDSFGSALWAKLVFPHRLAALNFVHSMRSAFCCVNPNCNPEDSLVAQIAHRFCSACNRDVAAVKGSASHVMHLILTFLTCSLWLFVWLFAIINKQYHCPHCGRALYSTAEKLIAGVLFVIFGGLVCLFGLSVYLNRSGALQIPDRPAAKLDQPVEAIQPPAVVEAQDPPAVVKPDDVPPIVMQPVPAQTTPALPPTVEQQITETPPVVTPTESSPKIDPKRTAMANSALALARSLIQRDNEAAAKDRLKKLIADFPETQAATEARSLLDKLK